MIFIQIEKIKSKEISENKIAKLGDEVSLYFGEKGIAFSDGKENFYFPKTNLDNLKASVIINDPKRLLSINRNIKNYFDISIAHNLINSQANYDLDSIIKI